MLLTCLYGLRLLLDVFGSYRRKYIFLSIRPDRRKSTISSSFNDYFQPLAVSIGLWFIVNIKNHTRRRLFSSVVIGGKSRDATAVRRIRVIQPAKTNNTFEILFPIIHLWLLTLFPEVCPMLIFWNQIPTENFSEFHELSKVTNRMLADRK